MHSLTWNAYLRLIYVSYSCVSTSKPQDPRGTFQAISSKMSAVPTTRRYSCVLPQQCYSNPIFHTLSNLLNSPQYAFVNKYPQISCFPDVVNVSIRKTFQLIPFNFMQEKLSLSMVRHCQQQQHSIN